MSINGDTINRLEISWGGVIREHLLMQHYFIFCYLTFLIILKLLLFCSVPGFLFTFRVASHAPNLLLHNVGTLLSFVSSFKLSHPLGLLVGSSSLVVGKDTASLAHRFLPVTEDRHTICVLRFLLLITMENSQR